MLRANWFPALLFFLVFVVIVHECWPGAATGQSAGEGPATMQEPSVAADPVWEGGNAEQIPVYSDSGKLIAYGRELIANTSVYLGPHGKISTVSNGMDCQNCHLKAGTQPFGNNFGRVYATYPQYRARSNEVQSVYGRINDCLRRSLNGKMMDTSTREMRAMFAYINWVGQDVPRGRAPSGTGLPKINELDRAAEPGKGSAVYVANCASCHGSNGEGKPNPSSGGYFYPPLWGEHSYNDGAGLYRLSSFAGFIKDNMPYGADYHSPKLSDEEAWDLAAFVNSRPRPHMDQCSDWAKRDKKPVDYPFGPYVDSFSERQHKYGPYGPIRSALIAAKR